MNTSISIREVTGHRFEKEGASVFTLADGILVARVKRDGKNASSSIPFLEVAKMFLESCNSQEAAIVRAWAEDRIGKVAA